MPNLTAKKEVEKILRKIPSNSTFEDIQYHIYVREKIAKGLDDIKKGRTLTSEEFDARVAKWLRK